MMFNYTVVLLMLLGFAFGEYYDLDKKIAD
jgi:hypothetical protein